MNVTKNLIQEGSKHYQQLLGFAPRRTKLEILDRSNWAHFCDKFDLEKGAEGVFMPRNLTSYILSDSEHASLNLFHEYFGHGLFVEYAKRGRQLEKLEKRLLDEELRKFKGSVVSSESLAEFRETNPAFNLIKKNSQKNTYAYELFAIWTEHYLSRLFGIEGFDKKYNNLPEEIGDGLEEMFKFQRNKGTLAFFYEMGMPRYCHGEKVRVLFEELYDSRAKSADLVIHYGSKKPYSDLDILVVSSEIRDFTNNWLDIYSFTKEQFDYAVSTFDVSVIDPLLKGEFISGDKAYFEQKRKKLIEQPIKQEAIYYNLIRSKQQKILSKQFPESSLERTKGESYARTYLRNALSLKRGNRILEGEYFRR